MMTMPAAVMTFTMTLAVMTAHHIRIIIQTSCQERSHLSVCISTGAAKQLNTRRCKCISCTAADTSTDQHIHALLCKKSAQSTMTLSIGIYNFRGNDFAVFYFINFKLFCMPKMLEHLTIIISYCNLHSLFSLSFGFLFAQRIIPAFNFQRCPFH